MGLISRSPRGGTRCRQSSKAALWTDCTLSAWVAGHHKHPEAVSGKARNIVVKEQAEFRRALLGWSNARKSNAWTLWLLSLLIG